MYIETIVSLFSLRILSSITYDLSYLISIDIDASCMSIDFVSDTYKVTSSNFTFNYEAIVS